jgi:TPR repeat protein
MKKSIAGPLAGIFILAACAGRTGHSIEMTGNKTSPPVAGVHSFNLTPEREQRLAALAAAGDNEASFQLAQFYDLVKLDPDQAIAWFRMGAVRGHPSSQYNLGVRLLARDDVTSRKEAIQWLEQAKAGGHSLADAALKDSRKSQQ